MLSALLGRTGTGKDLIEMRKRQRIIERKQEEARIARNQALERGILLQDQTQLVERSRYAPILVIVPPSVIENWLSEFETWGHFAVSKFHGPSRSLALESIRNGWDEIMVCGKSVFSQAEDVEAIKMIPWKLIVVDEFHQYKVRCIHVLIRMHEVSAQSPEEL